MIIQDWQKECQICWNTDPRFYCSELIQVSHSSKNQHGFVDNLFDTTMFDIELLQPNARSNDGVHKWNK